MNQSTTDNLFDPITLGSLELSNRIVMAPMTRCRAIGNVPNDLMATYYGQRSSAGLIITEGTSPSPNGLGYARIPGIYNEDQIEGWEKVTSSVHEKGGKIFLQIMHTGRVSHPLNMPENSKVLAPSAIPLSGEMWTDSQMMQPYPVPKSMDAADLEQAIGEYKQAAINAITAGFDGVEIHAANGYLLNQFLNPGSNQRSDNYGGSIENRVRFVIEAANAMVEAIGADKVGIRISPYGTFNDMADTPAVFETYDYLSKELEKIGLTYIHIVEGAIHAKPEGAKLLSAIRSNFSHSIIVNGGYDRSKAEEVVSNGHGDLVSFGALYISNPDLPASLLGNEEIVAPNPDTFYTADEIGYTDY